MNSAVVLSRKKRSEVGRKEKPEKERADRGSKMVKARTSQDGSCMLSVKPMPGRDRYRMAREMGSEREVERERES